MREKGWGAVGTIVYTPSLRQESIPLANKDGATARSLRHCALSQVMLYYAEEKDSPDRKHQQAKEEESQQGEIV